MLFIQIIKHNVAQRWYILKTHTTCHPGKGFDNTPNRWRRFFRQQTVFPADYTTIRNMIKFPYSSDSSAQ